MRRGVFILILAATVAVALIPAGVGGAATSLRPVIHDKKIPFPEHRRTEMRAYSKRHYGLNTFKLKTPHVIVEHVAEASSIQSIWNTFAPDHPDPEFGELPNVCAHFGVSKHGRIYKFVTPAWQCRHTVGLNYTAVGIEHVGFSDNQILSNREQMRGSLRLTRYLRCRLGIKLKNVIGHNESLSSPYFRERVRRFRNQTHGDWTHSHMERYRARLAKLSC